MEFKNIRELNAFEDEWALKVRLARKTQRETFIKNDKQTETMKLFLLDQEGTMVQATLFNELIGKFAEKFEIGKTYIIRWGTVKTINKSFDNANDRIEINFTSKTEVEESIESVPFKRMDDILNFKDIEVVSSRQRFMDVVGMVVRVRPAYEVKLKKFPYKATKKREVTLMDHMSNTIKLYLWGDLAYNEGEILETMVSLRPIVTVLNVVVNKYQDVLNLSTSFVSVVEINPTDHDNEVFEKSFEKFQTVGEGMNQVYGPSKRMKESTEDSLSNIIANKVDSFFCSFIGRIVKVLNKNEPWYEKCNKCNARVHPEGNNKTVFCGTCNNKYSSFTRYYRLKLLVTDGKEEVYATLFEAAETLVGCPVTTFADKLLNVQEKHSYDKYKNLIGAEDKQYKFLVKMDDKTRNEKANKNIIVEELLKVDGVGKEEGSSSLKRKQSSIDEVDKDEGSSLQKRKQLN